MTSRTDVDERLLAAHDLALAALAEVTPAATVGEPAGYTLEDGGVVSLRFANRLAGYPGWFWTVSVAVVEDSEPTVLEVELLPGDDALLAPEWVPWATRLADYQAAQAAAAAAEDADEDTGDLDEDDDSDDLDEDDDLDDSDEDDDELDSDGSPILHAGDLDGVDIDELDPDEDDADDDSEEDDSDDEDDDDSDEDDDDSDEDDADGDEDDSDGDDEDDSDDARR